MIQADKNRQDAEETTSWSLQRVSNRKPLRFCFSDLGSLKKSMTFLSKRVKDQADNNCFPLFPDLEVKLMHLVLRGHKFIRRKSKDDICLSYETGLPGNRQDL